MADTIIQTKNTFLSSKTISQKNIKAQLGTVVTLTRIQARSPLPGGSRFRLLAHGVTAF